MKDGVIIINTARGAIIDEPSLVAALNSGKVSSCGLDVFEEEPKIHPGLIGNQKVILLPHMGTWTVEVRCSSLFAPKSAFSLGGTKPVTKKKILATSLTKLSWVAISFSTQPFQKAEPLH